MADRREFAWAPPVSRIEDTGSKSAETSSACLASLPSQGRLDPASGRDSCYHRPSVVVSDCVLEVGDGGEPITPNTTILAEGQAGASPRRRVTVFLRHGRRRPLRSRLSYVHACPPRREVVCLLRDGTPQAGVDSAAAPRSTFTRSVPVYSQRAAPDGYSFRGPQDLESLPPRNISCRRRSELSA